MLKMSKNSHIFFSSRLQPRLHWGLQFVTRPLVWQSDPLESLTPPFSATRLNIWKTIRQHLETKREIRGFGKFFRAFFKVGGLNGRDQSRLRMSIVSRLTLENRRDYPSRRDQFFLSRSIFFKSRLFSRDLDVSRFLSRSSRQIETFQTNRDFRDTVKPVYNGHPWDLKNLAVMQRIV